MKFSITGAMEELSRAFFDYRCDGVRVLRGNKDGSAG